MVATRFDRINSLTYYSKSFTVLLQKNCFVDCICSFVLHMLHINIDNLILNWPKLLQPFKTFFHLISVCKCSQCDSTSLPVQRSQINKNVFVF